MATVPATYAHTRRFLAALLPPTSSSDVGTKRLSAESSRSGESNADEDGLPIASTAATSSSSASGSEVVTPSGDSDTDIRVQKILGVLESDAVQDEDRPDALKDMLGIYLRSEVNESHSHDLDSLVLSLLHRHREDVAPTGQTFAVPNSTPARPSVSRSSSIRRPFTPTLPINMVRRAGAVPARPLSPSPLRPNSPGGHATTANRSVSPSPLRPHSPHLTNGSQPGSPFLAGSPRSLNVTALEFQPRISSGTSPSPIPAPVWAPQHGTTSSPLGTPRIPPASASATVSYFPPVPSSSKPISRGPWQRDSPVGTPTDELDDDPFATTWAVGTGAALGMSQPDPSTSSPAEWMIGHPDFDDEWDGYDTGGQDASKLSPHPVVQEPSGAAGALGGLSGTAGAYTMTPLDMLCSIFAESDISAHQLEDALSRNGWDVDRTIEWLVTHQLRTSDLTQAVSSSPSLNYLSLDHASQSPRGASPRPPLPPSSSSGSPHWSSRPMTPSNSGQGSAYPPSAATNRVCRYYLQGSCLRSDCRYNHDISKAVCRFWLRGHCLKGPDRCDFMHSIPPHLAEDVALLRLRDRAERQQQQSPSRLVPPDLTVRDDHFPTLGTTTPSSPAPRAAGPRTARWAATLKNGIPRPPLAPTALMGRPAAGVNDSAGGGRPSPRLALRPPVLLPTLTTGQAVGDSYASYRATFLDLGAARARCLQRAAECWKQGDGAGARNWSREAQAHDRQRQAAGRDAARQILGERKRSLRDAVMRGDGREGRVDIAADRALKGREAGGGLGVYLGVAAAAADGSSQLEAVRLTAEERAEAAVDLHGLHAEEAIEFLSQFLVALERESFRGLAFAFVGRASHSVRTPHLQEAVTGFLHEKSYPYRLFAGVYAIDPQHHV